MSAGVTCMARTTFREAPPPPSHPHPSLRFFTPRQPPRPLRAGMKEIARPDPLTSTTGHIAFAPPFIHEQQEHDVKVNKISHQSH
ncbi:hypothetical protein E2C01_025702 [Portunus trituberculatus]|uniref:Uncharacterized protein n=1 Tax=Portunus trituberculatus TaxID=210409 RepID=A0A5B7EE19_PORTR|nr:hypothetical protein [Portunus trituberculatus]